MTDQETLARWRASTGRRVAVDGDGDPGSEGDTRTVFMSRRYDAVIDTVWDAWTNPVRLARWLAPVTGELRLGGEVVLDMSPEGQATCQIVECQPPRRLAVTWRFTGEPESAAELRLEPDGDGTILELEHGRLPVDLGVGYGYGWEDFLDRLGAMLAGDDPSLLDWDESQAALRPLWEASIRA